MKKSVQFVCSRMKKAKHRTAITSGHLTLMVQMLMLRFAGIKPTVSKGLPMMMAQ